MNDFLILTDLQNNKRLVSLDKIIHIDYYVNEGSSLFLIDNIHLTVKESVDEIVETMRLVYQY